MPYEDISDAELRKLGLMPKREPGLSDPPPAPRYSGLSWWPPIDPAWPEGQLAAFQCDFCWHAVKALQSSKPTCEPDLYGRRRRCHGRLMQGPYFPPAWLQGCVDCSLRKGASAWEVFLAGAVDGQFPSSLCSLCRPQSAILPQWGVLPEDVHATAECPQLSSAVLGSPTVCLTEARCGVWRCGVDGCKQPSNYAVHQSDLWDGRQIWWAPGGPGKRTRGPPNSDDDTPEEAAPAGVAPIINDVDWPHQLKQDCKCTSAFCVWLRAKHADVDICRGPPAQPEDHDDTTEDGSQGEFK